MYLSASSSKGRTALATVSAPPFANVNEPLGMKLSLTGLTGEVRVTWNSWNTSLVTVPRVKYGFTTDASPGVALATTASYSATDLCPKADGTPSLAQGVGFLAPGQLHSAVLSQLPPMQRVFYAVGSDATGWSNTFSFITPPAVGQPVRLVATSDVGVSDGDGTSGLAGTGTTSATLLSGTASPFTTPASRVTVARLANEVSAKNATLVLNAGGLSYAQGYGAQWNSVDDELQAVSSAAPMMVAVGNVDFDFVDNPHAIEPPFSNIAVPDSGGECGVPATLRFPMPWTAGASGPWYSFNYGSVHVTVMSTEHPFEAGSPQYAWLKADLEEAALARDTATFDATNTTASAPRWLVFMGHRPFYVNSGNGDDTTVAQALAQQLEQLWSTYGVDLTLSGHHHSYQRSEPIAYALVQKPCVDAPDAAGTTHVVVGNAGMPFSPLGGAEAELMVVSKANVNGYIRLDVTSRKLTLTALSSADGSVIDSMVLTKSTGPRACFPVLPGLDSSMPTLDKPTLIIALVIFSIVAVGYGLRACMEKYEEMSVERHAHHATAALLEAREQAAREFAEEEKRMSEDMRRFSAEREAAQRAREDALRQQAQSARASGEFGSGGRQGRSPSPSPSHSHSSPPQSTAHALPPLPPSSYAPPSHVSSTGDIPPPLSHSETESLL